MFTLTVYFGPGKINNRATFSSASAGPWAANRCGVATIAVLLLDRSAYVDINPPASICAEQHEHRAFGRPSELDRTRVATVPPRCVRSIWICHTASSSIRCTGSATQGTIAFKSSRTPRKKPTPGLARRPIR